MELLRINSVDRHFGTPANFVAELHTPVSGNYELESAVIPHTMPPVSTSNDSLLVVYEQPSGAPSLTRSVAVNTHYSVTSLLQTLTTALNVETGFTHSLAVDTASQVLPITLAQAASAYVGLSVTYYAVTDNAASTLATTLGLHTTKSLVGKASGTATVPLDGPVSLAYPLYYSIRIQGASNSIGDTRGRSSDLVVPIDVNTGDVIIHAKRTSFNQQLRIMKPVRSISVRLCDPAGNDVVRASDYSFLLKRI